MSDGIFDPKIPLEKVIEPTKQVISLAVNPIKEARSNKSSSGITE